MQVQTLAPGVRIIALPAEKFNRCRITIQFQFPADRSRATARALLPLVLARGYAGCPDMTQLSRRLAKLYGAGLSSEIGSNGANHLLMVRLTGIRDAFALAGEPLSDEYAALAFGVAFDPYLIDGAFDPEALAIEKGNLTRRLEAEINDKRLYCARQAARKYFGDAPAGISRDGYLEEVPSVTPQQLTEAYREILRTAAIDVFVTGMDPEPIARRLEQLLPGLGRAPVALLAPAAMPRQPLARYTERLELVQAKLCMMFTAAKPAAREEVAVYRLAMSLYGGSVTSRLFLNVREKQSLCYYCGSGFSGSVGCMTVNSGIEPADAERAEAAILHELQELCEGPITPQELEDCRRGLISGIASVEDSLGGLENWYLIELLRGGAVQSPAEAIEALGRVTEAQVREALRSFSHSVSYLVTAKEEGGAQDA